MEAANWSAAELEAMVRVFTEEKAAGNQAEQGWKPVVWTRIANELLSFKSAPEKEIRHCKSRWQRIRADYFIVKELRQRSRFEWDDTTQMVTASKEVWEKYLESHPKAKPFMKKPFPLYDAVEALVTPGPPPALGFKASCLGGGKSSNNNARGGKEDNAAGVVDPESLPSSTSDTPSHEEDESSESEAFASDIEDVVSSSNSNSLKRRPRRLSSITPPPKRVRRSGVDAILTVAKAVQSLASAIASDIDKFPTTPERRNRALEIVENEEGFTDMEMVDITELFMDKGKADMYMAFRNLRARRIWLDKSLAMMKRNSELVIE